MFVSTASLAKRRKEVDALEAQWLADVGEYDRSGDWSIDGFLSAASAIATTCRMDHGVARHYVELARTLSRLQEVAAAYAAGDLSLRHVRVFADAYSKKRAEALAAAEPPLVDAALEQTPKQLAATVRYATDAIDGDGGAESDADEFDDRRLYLSKTFRGRGDMRGNCDPVSFDIIEAALQAEMGRDRQAADERTTRARRMDALTNLCRHALDRGELGESHGVQPHVSAVVHLDENGGIVDQARAEFSRGGHLSANLLELLLCDCTLSRIIVAGESEILDVGRATPITTPAQWKALVVRDRHCQAPGCNRPPADCQSHHVQHWTRGGRTDLNNLQLLCWYHHRRQHIHDAQARVGMTDKTAGTVREVFHAGNLPTWTALQKIPSSAR
jgi:hypothetical protein